jgi:hypothetical protein
MNQFLNNLKREAQNNPLMALAIGTGLLTAAGRFIDSAGHAVGSRAYAKQVDYRIKKAK